MKTTFYRLLLFSLLMIGSATHAQPGSYHYAFGFNLYANGRLVDSTDGFIIEDYYGHGLGASNPHGGNAERHFQWTGVLNKKSIVLSQMYLSPIRLRIISPRKDTMLLTYYNRNGMDHYHFIDKMEFREGEYEVISFQFAQSRVLLGNEFFLSAYSDSAGYRTWYCYYDNDSSRLSSSYTMDTTGRIVEHISIQPDSSWHVSIYRPEYLYRQYSPDGRLTHWSIGTEQKQWNDEGELIFHMKNENGQEVVYVDER
ncbi:MAG: hypothetical protein HWD92_07465 [Flavobacteriia bacterium]|nr:hypothetical protein [Flavobacteriia bacterium]